mmetsp:Transcript_27707/g.74955  ORF Transcript_27707/g.74955 Transcript_27707/m.74955 type:complete len:261 (+) Transcript_27707:251-1033(+)
MASCILWKRSMLTAMSNYKHTKHTINATMMLASFVMFLTILCLRHTPPYFVALHTWALSFVYESGFLPLQIFLTYHSYANRQLSYLPVLQHRFQKSSCSYATQTSSHDILSLASLCLRVCVGLTCTKEVTWTQLCNCAFLQRWQFLQVWRSDHLRDLRLGLEALTEPPVVFSPCFFSPVLFGCGSKSRLDTCCHGLCLMHTPVHGLRSLHFPGLTMVLVPLQIFLHHPCYLSIILALVIHPSLQRDAQVSSTLPLSFVIA